MRKSVNISIKSNYKNLYELVDKMPDKSLYICRLIERDLADKLSKMSKEEFIENFHLII